MSAAYWKQLSCSQRDSLLKHCDLKVYSSRTYFPTEDDGIYTEWYDEDFKEEPILVESYKVHGQPCRHDVRLDYLLKSAKKKKKPTSKLTKKEGKELESKEESI